MLRKPPSLSTLALPNFSGFKPPSQSLVNALRSLIAQLPQENRDLIRTVTELIKATAKNSKETKMPLSNLLLVFCPSLNMNPPLLRALCEYEGIWEESQGTIEAPIADIVPQDSVIDKPPPLPAKATNGIPYIAQKTQQDPGDKVNSTEEKMPKEPQFAGKHPTLRSGAMGRRGPVPTVYLDSDGSGSALVLLEASTRTETSSQDDASCDSTSEEPSKEPFPVSINEFHPDVPPPLSSSIESLTTPSTSSFSHLPIPVVLYSKSHKATPPGSPMIAESTNMPLAPRRPVISSPISGPIPFPPTGPLPPPTTPLSRPRSFPHLSLPSFSVQTDDSSPNSPSSKIRRMKKPSLNLLFTKAVASSPSTPSLISFSPYLQGRSASDSSTSTPTSAVTAQSRNSVASLAPVLDTTIDSSPLGLDVVVGNAGEIAKRGTIKVKASSILRSFSNPENSPISSSYTRSQTPIADIYLTPAASLYSLTSSKNIPLVSQTRSLRSRCSDGSLMETASDSNDGDWTQRVVLAADVDSKWLSRHSGAATALS
jgi:hypothetical protein